MVNTHAMKQRENTSRSPVRDVNSRLLADWPLPEPTPDSDRTDRGRVLVVAGSRQMPGAAILAGVAALRAGALRLTVATARSAAMAVALGVPEAQVVGLRETPKGGLSRFASRECDPEFDAIVVGPGIRDDDAIARLVQGLRATYPNTPMVLDGRAIGVLQNETVVWSARAPGPIVITASPAELADLLGGTVEAVLANGGKAAARIASRWRLTVALKGPVSCVAMPDGTTWSHSSEESGLAIPGGGDVLAGVVPGLVARGASPEQAAVWGLALVARAAGGLAARSGPIGYLAREMASQIPGAMHRLKAAQPGHGSTRRREAG
jgi:hydroxyethylthiazole kinase-like uncharacterized protein yjeF